MKTETTRARSLIEAAYFDATIELLAAYGHSDCVAMVLGGAPMLGGSTLCSVLGATADGIQLVSTLQFDTAVLISLHPSAGKDISAREIEDWCGEVNNQLIGRVKNKLLRFGCELALGLPTVVAGTDLTSSAPAGAHVGRYRTESALGVVALEVVTMLAPNCPLESATEAPEVEGQMEEGMIALF